MGRVRLAGVSFQNADGSSRQEILGDIYDRFWTEGQASRLEINLVAEPTNPHDPNAIRVDVWIPGPGLESVAECFTIGYVEKEKAPAVRRAWIEGRVGRVRFADMKAGSKGNVSAVLGLAAKASDSA